MGSYQSANDKQVGDLGRCEQGTILRSRSERFIRVGRQWFFRSSEGTDIGPFDEKNHVQLALVYFLSHNSWPSAKQLRAYIQNSVPVVSLTADLSTPEWLRG